MSAVNGGEAAVAAGIGLEAVAVVAEIRGRLFQAVAEVGLELHLRCRGVDMTLGAGEHII